MTYKNPILTADFSDPDAIRVGEDYYMIASSFTYLPGVPVLHSRDLVHWRQIGNCVQSLPHERYSLPAHGCGTWAPSLRYHDGLFWAFIPLPDEGIYVTSATRPDGEWSPLHCIKSTVGWIDPCPIWDDDGSVYMAHAFANSRCGIMHKIQMSRLDPATLDVIDDGKIVFDGVQTQPTAEGPKLYKRGGFYYIFIPAGGVETGWQTVLRSKNIYGPYEEKIVLHQGNTPTNGPHQGAWITDTSGKDWFIHFQDKAACGRIVHLQPMSWQNDWPFIGREQNGDGIGEPVREWTAPCGENILLSQSLSKAWQWQANPQEKWCKALDDDKIILCGEDQQKTLWQMPNVLSQRIPAESFTFSADITLTGAAAGIGVLGLTYSALQIIKTANGFCAQLILGKAQNGAPTAISDETVICESEVENKKLRLTLKVQDAQTVQYFINGKAIGTPQPVTKCVWTGARLALFCKGEGSACLFENAQLDINNT